MQLLMLLLLIPRPGACSPRKASGRSLRLKFCEMRLGIPLGRRLSTFRGCRSRRRCLHGVLLRIDFEIE